MPTSSCIDRAERENQGASVPRLAMIGGIAAMERPELLRERACREGEARQPGCELAEEGAGSGVLPRGRWRSVCVSGRVGRRSEATGVRACRWVMCFVHSQLSM